MSLGTYLLGVVVALVIVPSCYSDDFCDREPPGTFCLTGLAGYRTCVYNKTTGKMDDKIYQCPPNTRCTCMMIPCQTSTPCGSYRLPPVWPQDYSIDFNTIDKVCSPTCHTTYSRYAIWRDTKNKKYRVDATIAPHDPAYEYYIVFGNYESSFNVFHIIPSKTSCTKSTIKTFPKKIPDIGTFFKYDGTEVVTGITTNRWLWKKGGRNQWMSIDTYIWNSYNGKPLQYRMDLPRTHMGTFSRNFQGYAGTFVPGTPDQEVFVLPNYCEREQELSQDDGSFEKLSFFNHFE